MSHYLTIEDAFDGPRLSLECTAPPDAPCRLRPSDGRESWNSADPDLTPGHECWAVEWAEEGGWETVSAADGVTWPRIPVAVEYDEGVVIAPAVVDRDALTDERDSLSWQVEALRAERDARSAERDALADRIERVRALPVGPPSGGYYMVSMRDVLAALDGES